MKAIGITLATLLGLIAAVLGYAFYETPADRGAQAMASRCISATDSGDHLDNTAILRCHLKYPHSSVVKEALADQAYREANDPTERAGWQKAPHGLLRQASPTSFTYKSPRYGVHIINIGPPSPPTFENASKMLREFFGPEPCSAFGRQLPIGETCRADNGSIITRTR